MTVVIEPSYQTQPCGCIVPADKMPRFWFYKPELREPKYWFYPKSPVWFGGDEFCRRTLVLGWNVTGQLVVALRTCRGCEQCHAYPRTEEDWTFTE